MLDKLPGLHRSDVISRFREIGALHSTRGPIRLTIDGSTSTHRTRGLEVPTLSTQIPPSLGYSRFAEHAGSSLYSGVTKGEPSRAG